MHYNISPKKTTYNGRVYRSRLEARWQAMFDSLGWDAEYEPSEINGYNPDFIIRCKSSYYVTNTIIVEVKPSVMITKDFIEDVLNKYKNLKSHILILDDMPFIESSDCYGGVKIGVGSQYFPDIECHLYDTDMIMKGLFDFSSYTIIWDGMIFGKIDRKYFTMKTDEEYHTLKFLWNTAGNKVMFNI